MGSAFRMEITVNFLVGFGVADRHNVKAEKSGRIESLLAVVVTCIFDRERGALELAVAGAFLCQQRLHFSAQIRVAAARAIQKHTALPGASLPRLVIDRLDLLPTLGMHRLWIK